MDGDLKNYRVMVKQKKASAGNNPALHRYSITVE
jgi:hypothetical protein